MAKEEQKYKKPKQAYTTVRASSQSEMIENKTVPAAIIVFMNH